MTPERERGTSNNLAPAAKENLCRVKCVLVGDGAVGKTSLIIGYTTNGYPKEYMPTAYDKYSVIVNVNNKPIRLQICDTAGQDDFDALRPLCYPRTDVYLLCFSVVYPTSFHNAREKWLPEIRRHSPRVPVLLVGTQADLRADIDTLIDLATYREQPVSREEGREMAARLGAAAYVECSAVTRRNLKEVFDSALLAALKGKGLLGAGEEKRKRRGWKRLWCFS
ncbi:hypothetical protein JTE90_004411 [Oedothorax gibbosus]|uniref:Uncharacterized protein n=1 Tax=Oedothorax gibbosus TaxID=931172 RepID=A0AAV6UNK2_9ARAC|nr:hypothetical protein JTE90_004411 [Oedothorax gibbosus]